uniref:Uncharacterized protein n=1 Tax=Theropithecus gelada TaxID=9565 RepID=A0A8D2EBV6_THEGE
IPRISSTTVAARSVSSLMGPMARAVAPHPPLKAVGLSPATTAASAWSRYLEVAPPASSWRSHPSWKASATT